MDRCLAAYPAIISGSISCQLPASASIQSFSAQYGAGPALSVHRVSRLPSREEAHLQCGSFFRGSGLPASVRLGEQFTSRLCRVGGRRSGGPGVCRASGVGDLGDFGARDPFPGEIASDFGNNVQGNADTEHRIKVPANVNLILGLAQYKCQALEEGAAALSEDDCKALLRKVVGWKLAEVEGKPRLRGEWKVKHFTAGLELFQRIAAVAEAEGHHPDLHLEGWNNARADIWSHSVGGLTVNDFILAAKIDLVDTRDLMTKKNKFWA